MNFFDPLFLVSLAVPVLVVFLVYSWTYLRVIKSRYGGAIFYPSGVGVLGVLVHFFLIFFVYYYVVMLMDPGSSEAWPFEIFTITFSMVFGVLFLPTLIVYYISKAAGRNCTIEASMIMGFLIPCFFLIFLCEGCLDAFFSIVGAQNIMAAGGYVSGGLLLASLNYIRITFGTRDPLGLEAVGPLFPQKPDKKKSDYRKIRSRVKGKQKRAG
ncbi:MAG: hypothetical protein JW724_03430 [Candidatus Altiarchaeota archaeon]|nr:hypothetical protein [Candidatus Altiarchaeota archaeon]